MSWCPDFEFRGTCGRCQHVSCCDQVSSSLCFCASFGLSSPRLLCRRRVLHRERDASRTKYRRWPVPTPRIRNGSSPPPPSQPSRPQDCHSVRPPLHLLGGSMGMERGRRQTDSFANGYPGPQRVLRPVLERASLPRRTAARRLLLGRPRTTAGTGACRPARPSPPRAPSPRRPAPATWARHM